MSWRKKCLTVFQPDAASDSQDWGQSLPVSFRPDGDSALALALLLLLCSVRVLVASSSGTYQLPPSMHYFLFSFLGQHPHGFFS